MAVTSPQIQAHSTPVTPAVRDANFFHLYWDVAWYGVAFGSTLSFLAVFATRLGAANWQVGLLSAGPALMNVLFTLPAGRWLAQRPLGQAVNLSALGQRVGFILLAPLPLLLPAAWQIWAAMLLVFLMAIPGTALAVGFNALLATAVEPDWRGHVVGRRNALLSAAIMITFLLSGRLLDTLPFAWGYTLVFGIGAVGAVMSTYHLFRIKLPDTSRQFEGRLIQDRARPGRGIGFGASAASYRLVSPRLMLNWRPRRITDFEQVSARYWRVMVAYGLFHFTQLLPAAVFPIVWVREAHLTDGQIGWINAVYYLVMLGVAPFLAPLSRRFGNYRLTVAGALSLGLYPLLVALSYEMVMLTMASVVIGLVWAILSGALVNRLLEIIPEDARAPHLALYNLALNGATLAGTMLGPMLGDWIGMREALVLIAILRLVSGAVMVRWG